MPYYDDPEVMAAVETVWRDSQPDSPDEFHEEGGSIFWHPEIGEYHFERCEEGTYNRLGYDLHSDRMPIATYHTHPGLGVWVRKECGGVFGRGPSGLDLDFVKNLDLPMLIRDPWRLYRITPPKVVVELRSYPSPYPMPAIWPWVSKHMTSFPG